MTDYSLYDYENGLYIELTRCSMRFQASRSRLAFDAQQISKIGLVVALMLMSWSKQTSSLSSGTGTRHSSISRTTIGISNLISPAGLFLRTDHVVINQMAEAAVVDVHFDVDPIDGMDIIKTSGMIETQRHGTVNWA